MIDEIANPRPVLVGETLRGHGREDHDVRRVREPRARPRRPGAHLEARARQAPVQRRGGGARRATSSPCWSRTSTPQGKISLKPVGEEWEARPRAAGRRVGTGRRGGGDAAAAAASATGVPRRRRRGGRDRPRGRRFRDAAERRAPARALPTASNAGDDDRRAPSTPRVCVSSRSGCPACARSSLGVWVLAGSRDERPQISGSSHFLEHLLFKGTKRRTRAGHRGGVRRRRRRPERVHREGVHVLLRARARPRPGDGGRPSGRHAPALGDRARRTSTAERQVILEEINMHEDSPEDLVHDLFTETLWPDHPLGRPVLGTRRHDRGGDPRLGQALLQAPLRARRTSWWRRPATSGTTTLLALLADAHGHRDARSPRATTRRGTCGARRARRRRRRARAWSAGARREQAHICLGTNGLARTRSRAVRVPRGEHGARRRDVVAAVPGDPGEARAGVLGVQLPLAVHRGRVVHARTRARRRRARERGDRAAPPRARRRRVRRPHRGGVRAREAAT